MNTERELLDRMADALREARDDVAECARHYREYHRPAAADYCLNQLFEIDALFAEYDLAKARFDAAEYIATAAANPCHTFTAATADAPAKVAGELIAQARAWFDGAPHGDNCFVSDHYEGDPGNRCNCGRDSLERAFEAYDENPQTQPSAAGDAGELCVLAKDLIAEAGVMETLSKSHRFDEDERDIYAWCGRELTMMANQTQLRTGMSQPASLPDKSAQGVTFDPNWNDPAMRAGLRKAYGDFPYINADVTESIVRSFVFEVIRARTAPAASDVCKAHGRIRCGTCDIEEMLRNRSAASVGAGDAKESK